MNEQGLHLPSVHSLMTYLTRTPGLQQLSSTVRRTTPPPPPYPTAKVHTAQERLTQASLARKVAKNRDGAWSQKPSFPRTPALCISDLLHSRRLCSRHLLNARFFSSIGLVRQTGSWLSGARGYFVQEGPVCKGSGGEAPSGVPATSILHGTG